MYNIDFTPIALKGINKLRKSEPACYRKFEKLLEELKEHPSMGTGHPERLIGMSVPTWSRKINSRHRLVYEIVDERVLVIILSAYGHYGDK